MIYDVRWFNGRLCVGIVRVNNGHDVKYYIGVAKGYDEDDDVRFIAAFGAMFPTAAGNVLFMTDTDTHEPN